MRPESGKLFVDKTEIVLAEGWGVYIVGPDHQPHKLALTIEELRQVIAELRPDVFYNTAL